jgi:hypothetical protein
MQLRNMNSTSMRKLYNTLLVNTIIAILLTSLSACGNKQNSGKGGLMQKIESVFEAEIPDDYTPASAMLVVPLHPSPGEKFHIVSAGGRSILKANLTVSGAMSGLKAVKQTMGSELPYWRIDEFEGTSEGSYTATITGNGEKIAEISFKVSANKSESTQGNVWKTRQSWSPETETLYSAWVNALFSKGNEQSSWPALHEVTQNKEFNFLYNALSLDEDNASGKTRVLMEPDCADNPYFLRAYFAWKLGLPFGFHIADRGWMGKAPSTGQWITNESPSSKKHPVLAFNSFIRTIMNGVHSGTARAALDNENTDYYPVALNKESLRPGTIFADPYGHTFVLVSRKAQTKSSPGVLLAADAQPDKTIAIKRFWKGNFLFNTSEVIGEPGFKAFRPIMVENGKLTLMKNQRIDQNSGFVPFSMEQKNLDREVFYHNMDRVINPNPLNPEEAMEDLIKALHEQVLVRIKSVQNGEEYMKSHPSTIIPMPGGAKGVFQTGGLWEDYSTPNRDLRLLIAIDAVIGFPERVAKYPEDFDLRGNPSAEEIKDRLQKMLEKEIENRTVTYIRSDGKEQQLTLKQIIDRREALEMAYNPNDGVEIRWGAPENSEEIKTCKRRAPANQRATMQSVRKWFAQRLHPPT